MSQAVNRDAGAPDAALADIAARFGRPLRSFFRKRAFNEQEAEDLVQEVFCRLAARANASELQHADAYVFQVAANLLRDRARRDLTRRVAHQEIAATRGLEVEEISPERVLLGKQRLMRLESALKELPEKTRMIFLLHRFENQGYGEIARSLGVSASAVEKHMMAAMRHIRTRLERD